MPTLHRLLLTALVCGPLLARATEPVLAPIRRMVGWRMNLDLSPMIAILILVFLQYAVVQSIRDIAVRMH